MLSNGRPSPAVLLTSIAIVFALAGTAVAGSDGMTKKVTKSKVKSIARKQVGKLAPGLAVASADSLHARALIQLEPVRVGLAKNIAQVQVDNPRVGIVCFDLDFVPTNVQVTDEIDGITFTPAILSAVIDPLSRLSRDRPAGARGNALNACDPGTDVQVNAVDRSTGNSINTSFFIEVSR